MMVGERGLRASAMLALRAVAKATWSRCARLKPPSEAISRVLRSSLRANAQALFKTVPDSFVFILL